MPVSAASDHDDGASLAFRRLFRRHYAFVWRSLRAMGLNDSSADDASQEVFMVLHRRLGEYDPGRDLRGWLYGIARMIARKHGEQRQREHRRRQRLRDGSPPEAPLVAGETDPEDALRRRQAADVVQAFLDRLDPDQRQVFVLAEIEALPAPQIARMLDVSVNTVYSRLRLARERFAAYVKRRRAIDHRESRSG
ncbi:MAG: sigma-70 family RNA polymerase sigma factor [Myxococcales bacterium FL481]|nr:MAG: sigma-70 family RNA polymerase sigma factor [Myxococcales bacterium FL481]